MWQRLFLFLLLIYLLLNLPFITTRTYKREVYLYKNALAVDFLKKHPDMKKLVHLTRNTKRHPLFFITDNQKDTLKKYVDLFYLIGKKDDISLINHIPTHAFIGDTVRFKSNNGKDTFIVISKKTNTIYFKENNMRVVIKGIPKNVYVIDTLWNFMPYHGALRRYFEQKPFITFVAINPYQNRLYLDDKIKLGGLRLKPIIYIIGKDLIVKSDNPVENPRGFYLALEDTILPVSIKTVSPANITPDTTLAYLIGGRKYPLFFIKDGKGYITTKKIDVLYRKYPAVFNKIMDKMIELTARPVVIGYPEKHIYRLHEPVTIHVLDIPHIDECFVQRNRLKEPLVFNTYTFIPEKKDTQVIVLCKDIKDTIKLTLINRTKNILFNQDEFIQRIKSNAYVQKMPFFAGAQDSTLFYVLLLIGLVVVWIIEKKRTQKD